MRQFGRRAAAWREGADERDRAVGALVGIPSTPPIDEQSVAGDPLQARMREIRDALLVQAAVRLLASPSACEMLHINNSSDAVNIIADAWKRIQTPD